MITLLLVLILAISNACMDMNFSMYHKSVFSKLNQQFWNPYESWRNKWKNGDSSQGEKFPGSTTFFVFVTDSWHLFKFVFVNTLFISIITYKPLLGYYDIILYSIIWFIGFEITKKLLTLK